MVISNGNFVFLYALVAVLAHSAWQICSGQIGWGFNTPPALTDCPLLFVLKVAGLFFLCVLCWLRGNLIFRPWLVTFSVVAMVFAIHPEFQRYEWVSAFMHMLSLICGVCVGGLK